MTQTAKPVRDVSTGLWTPTPVFAQINGQSAGSKHVTSGVASPDSFEIDLSPLAWPDKGPRILTVTLGNTTADLINAAIVLQQGDLPIAAWLKNPPTGFTTYNMDLTEDQMNSITDYSKLRLRMMAGDIQVDCCPKKVSTILKATFFNKTGSCACVPDEGTLVHGVRNVLGWGMYGRICDVALLAVDLILACQGANLSGFTLSAFTGATLYNPISTSSSCDPFALTFGPIVGDCLRGQTGSFFVTIAPPSP